MATILNKSVVKACRNGLHMTQYQVVTFFSPEVYESI